MLKRTVRLVLNNNKFGSQTTVEGVHKRDDNSCELIITLTDGYKVIDLGENPVAVMSGTKPDGTVISNPCEIVDGKIKYTLTKQDTAVSGNVLYQVTVADGNNIEESIIASAKFTVAVMNNIYIPIYRLLNEEPTDWSTNYKSYYELVGNAYKLLNNTVCPEFEANTFYYLVNPNYDSKDSFDSYITSLIRLENLIGRASDIQAELDEIKYEISKAITIEKLDDDVKTLIDSKTNTQQLGNLASLEQLLAHTDTNKIYFGVVTNNFSDIFGYPDTSMSLRFMMWLVEDKTLSSPVRCLLFDDGTFWKFRSITDKIPVQMTVKKDIIDQMLVQYESKFNKVDEPYDVENEHDNYPSIRYLNEWYYNYNKTDDLLENKYDSSNVETGTGTLTPHESHVSKINTATFEYQKVGDWVNLHIYVDLKAFTPALGESLMLSGLPYVCKNSVNPREMCVSTQKKQMLWAIASNSTSLTLLFFDTSAFVANEKLSFSLRYKIV